MSNVHLAGPVAWLEESQSAVYFSMNNSVPSGKSKTEKQSGTALQVKKMQSALEVAYWGEDNRFPQNIERHISYCGVAKSALDFKSRVLQGNGIIAGKVTGYEDEGKKEIFIPLTGSTAEEKECLAFINNRRFHRFMMEYCQDWVWYANCFPEIIFSYDCKKITGFVHQESCDARYKQMDSNGNIGTVYLSKLWGAAKDQFALFDPKKAIVGLIENPKTISDIDGSLVKALDCIDMYDPLESAQAIASQMMATKKITAMKSCIMPVNYPSVNKPYYQVPYWDGARLSGWMEIAAKIPNLYKSLYNKAFNIKYHIEIPESFLSDKYGFEIWSAFTEDERTEKKKELLKEMNDFLAGDENAYKSFISFFSVNNIDKTEYGRVKITAIENKSNIDKDLILGSAATVEILMNLQVHPSIFSAGMTGNVLRSGGGSGSDIREAFLVMTSLLKPERELLLEPLYLARDYNGWGDDITFRFRDTVLTTLDKGKGTEKTVS